MSVRLVTAFKGYDEQGEPIKNVSSTDDATLYAALVGPDDYVFDRGQRLAGTMEDANTLVVADGDGLINGHHFIVDGTLSFTIPTGTQGMQVSNLACLRYTKDAKDIQDVAPVVLTGEPVAEDPQDPAYNEGSILDGDATVDMPLYRVVTTGISAGEPEALFATVGPLADLDTEFLVIAGQAVPPLGEQQNATYNGVHLFRQGRMVTITVRGGSQWGPYIPNDRSYVELCTIPEERLRPVTGLEASWVTPGGASYGVVVCHIDGSIRMSMSSGSGQTNYYSACFSYLCQG